MTDGSPTSRGPSRTRGWTAGALVAVVVAIVVALVSSGADDESEGDPPDDVEIPSTTAPPTPTTTIGPWEAMDEASLPPAASALVAVGSQLVAYHTVDGGEVALVVVDVAEARVNWQRTVAFPYGRISGVAIPPPAYTDRQNLLHVLVEETQRATEPPPPGETPTPTPTPEPRRDPGLAVVGIDASDGFGITDVAIDVTPVELPSVCGDVICFPAVKEGEIVTVHVDPLEGATRVLDVGLQRTVAVDGPDAITMGDLPSDDFTGPVVATTAYGAREVWRSSVEALFDGADVSPNRGWRSVRGVDGRWAVWLPARAGGDPPEGDVFASLGPGERHPPGRVSVIDGDDGRVVGVLDGSLCRSLLPVQNVTVAVVAVCDGGWQLVDGRLVSNTDAIRLVDADTAEVVEVIPVAPFDDFDPAGAVRTVGAAVFEIETIDGPMVLDLVTGASTPGSGPDVVWCAGVAQSATVVDQRGGMRAHRLVPPLFPCVDTDEVPAPEVADLLRDGELDPDDIGFVRVGEEWVVWVGPERVLRAVRLGDR